MINLSSEFCQKLRLARRQARLTQSELAREVGCKQSALSMFEQGDGTKLNDEVINRLSKKFDIVIMTAESSVETQKLVAQLQSPASGYCPNPHCPSNHAYRVEEKILYRPDRGVADPIGGKYCAICGELLERHCPNCGGSVHDGAICSVCGEPYVVCRGVIRG